MNKKVKLALALLLAASIGLTLNGCKKTTDPGTTTKTLNKSLLVGKTWYNDLGDEQLDIRANGKFSVYGTWKWVNNSDTFECDLDGPGTVDQPERFKMYWTTEHEMEANRLGSSKELFKDAPW